MSSTIETKYRVTSPDCPIKTLEAREANGRIIQIVFAFSEFSSEYSVSARMCGSLYHIYEERLPISTIPGSSLSEYMKKYENAVFIATNKNLYFSSQKHEEPNYLTSN